MLAIGIFLGLGAFALYLTTKATFRVDEGHVGVLSSFGAAEFLPNEPNEPNEKKRLRVHGPGVHVKWPWQRALVVSIKEQNLELSGETRGQQAMARDGTILRFDSILRYVPDPAKLAQFLFGMRDPLEHITGLFSCLLRNEIANFHAAESLELDAVDNPAARRSTPPDFMVEAGSYALIRRERRLLNERIEEFCNERIGDLYGVKFNAVDLVDILPPDELADALNAVIQARTEAEAAYFGAEGECQQRVLAAGEGVQIARVRARAVENEIDKLAEFLRELSKIGVLTAYVARRRSEVHSEARALL